MLYGWEKRSLLNSNENYFILKGWNVLNVAQAKYLRMVFVGENSVFDTENVVVVLVNIPLRLTPKRGLAAICSQSKKTTLSSRSKTIMYQQRGWICWTKFSIPHAQNVFKWHGFEMWRINIWGNLKWQPLRNSTGYWNSSHNHFELDQRCRYWFIRCSRRLRDTRNNWDWWRGTNIYWQQKE